MALSGPAKNINAFSYTSCCLAGLFTIVNIVLVGPSQDTYTLLHYAVVLLKEGGLYSRWVFLNSPLAVATYLPPAAAIIWLGLPAGFTLHLYTGALCCGSLLVTSYALRVHAIGHERRLFWLTAAAVTLAVTSSEWSVFADREHLLFIFALPWMIQMVLGLRPLTFTAVVAALGFLLKPYNLVFFVALQLLGGPEVSSWRRRVFNASSAMIVLVGLVYLVIVYECFPSYIRDVMPLAAITYPYVYLPLQQKLLLSGSMTAAATMLVFECIATRERRRVWYGFLSAAVVVYCLNAGWRYTLYLLFAPMTLLCFLLYERGYEGDHHRLSAIATRRIALGSIVLLALHSMWFVGEDVYYTWEDGYPRNYVHMSPSLSTKLRAAAGTQFILLSTTLWSTNISTLSGSPHSAFAYDFLWPLPWLYDHPKDTQAPYVKDMLATALLRALKEHPEAALIVDTSARHWKLPDGTDLLQFFRTDDRINEELNPYTHVDTIDGCNEPNNVRDWACSFAVWKLKPR